MSHWGHIGGLTALAATYSIAGVLAIADGPLPFGDAIAVGILAVPDPVIYGIGFAIAEPIGHGAYAFPFYDKRPKSPYDYSVMI